MSKRTEKLFVLTLVGSFLLFLMLCSCDNENLIDPPNFFESADSYSSGDPDFWPQCTHTCGTPALPPHSNAAPPPGDEILICTGPTPTPGPICLEYTLHSQADVAIAVYSQKGEKIKTLVRERQFAVTYSCMWDLTDDSGRGVTNGTYRVFFKAGDYVTHGDIIVSQ